MGKKWKQTKIGIIKSKIKKIYRKTEKREPGEPFESKPKRG